MLSTALTRLVGRERELEALAGLLAAADGNRAELVLVTGEAGIGKTALARAVSERAAAEGWAVAWGRCWDGAGAPAYWPWVQVLRSVVGEAEPAAAAQPWLAALHPSLRRGDVEAPPLPPDQARFALLDAVAATLSARAARSAGLLVVLDDVHAADASSLTLARFAARTVPGAPLVVLATARLGAAADGEVATLVEELAADAWHVELPRLDEAALAELVALERGEAPSEAEVAQLRRTTGGNPFFVHQVLHWDTRLPVPVAVRAVVQARLAALPPEVRGSLLVAAVVGTEFEPAAIAAVAGDGVATGVDEALEAAARAGIVERVPDDYARLRFAHGLFQQATITALPAEWRVKLHARIADALDEVSSPDDPVRTARIAEHRRAAVAVVGVGPMVAACAAAANAATRALALERAVAEADAGLGVLASVPGAYGAERAALLVARGRAESMLGRVEAARATYGSAADAARASGRADLFAACALSMPSGRGSMRLDPYVRALVEEALDYVPDDHPELRAPLLARLATELPLAAREERRAVADEALAIARTVGDRTVAEVLRLRGAALHEPDLAEDRLHAARELTETAERLGDPRLRLDAALAVFAAALAAGRPDEAEEALERYDRLIAHVDVPALRVASHARHACLAVLKAQFGRALELAEQAQRLASHAGLAPGEQSHRAQTATVRRLQGEPDPTSERELVDTAGVPRWVVAKMRYDDGRVDEARTELRQGVAELPGLRSGLLGGALAAGAELANRMNDRDVAASVLPLLEPAANTLVITADAQLCLGSAALWLGHALEALGRRDAAVERFADAVAANEAIGAEAFAVVARAELARVLELRGSPGDAERAADVRARAAAAARRLGMAASRTPGAGPQLRDEPPPGGAWTLRRAGAAWVVGTGGATAQIPHTKGLTQLARLLACPGREVSAADLLCDQPAAPSAAGAPVLDAQAKAEYLRRLRLLDEELDGADARGDASAAAALDAERASLVEQLRRASGLGGRARLLGDDAERARVNVTRTVRQAIERVAQAAPEIGAHLARSVRTGLMCAYLPQPGEQVTWQL